MEQNSDPEILGGKDIHSLVKQLENFDLSQLRNLRYRLGGLLHPMLLQQQIGLLCNSGIAPGMEADALASNDKSSQYLQGGLVRYSSLPGDLRSLASLCITEGFSLAKEAGLNNCQIIAGAHGFASGERAGEIMSFAGNHGTFVSECFDFSPKTIQSPEDKRTAIQEVAAILTMYQIMAFLDVIQDANSRINALLYDSQTVEDPLTPDVQDTKKLNRHVWQEIFLLIKKKLNGGKISIGESFTCGLLANLMTSIEGATNILDTYLNWYDPLLKAYVGVPNENLKWDRIAEPDTIALASSGLFNRSNTQTSITIGTTGYANYWEKGKADYFSIGVSTKESDGLISTITARVEVDRSKNITPSWGRRQLTRNLGVTVALYLLCKKLSQENPQLVEISIRLEQYIKGYCGEMKIAEFK